MKITFDHMKKFSSDGAVLLKGAFHEFVEGARNAIEENIRTRVGEKEHIGQMTVGRLFFRTMSCGTNLTDIEI